jgi:hypothetical protein
MNHNGIDTVPRHGQVLAHPMIVASRGQGGGGILPLVFGLMT